MGMKNNIKIINKKHFLKNINFIALKNIFFFVSIIYLIYCLKNNLNNISLEIDLDFFKFHIIFSFAFCFLSIFFNAYAWVSILSWLGFRGNTSKLISHYILTNSLKYVPGGIWHFVERFNYLKIRANEYLSFYALILEPYIMLSCSLMFVSLGAFKFSSPFFLFFLIPSIFLNKKLIYPILFKLEKLKKRSIELFNIPNSKTEVYSNFKLKSFFPIKSLILEMLFILTKFIGFMICFSIFNNNIQNNFVLFIVFCLSWTIGLIVPAAPGGLGVFEASYIFLIPNDFNQSSIIETLIYFRVIATIADLILSSPFLLKIILKKS